MAISQLAANLLPTTTAALLYTSRATLKEQKTGDNPFTFAPTLILEQIALWKGVEVCTGKDFGWIKITCIATSAIAYVVVTTRILEEENLSNDLDPKLRKGISSLRTITYSLDKHRQSVSRITAFLAYLYLAKKRPIQSIPALAILTIYEIRERSYYIPDTIQSKILSTLTKIQRVSFFFELSGKKLFYVAFLHINVFFPWTTYTLTGNRCTPLREGGTNLDKEVCSTTPEQINYAYVRHTPSPITLCSTTEVKTAEEIKAKITELGSKSKEFFKLLDQLENGTFEQGGVLDAEDMLQRITFIVAHAENNPENAEIILENMFQVAGTCASAIVYNINQLVAQFDSFVPEENSLKQKIYTLLQRYRTEQMYQYNIAIAHLVASYFLKGDPLIQVSHDNHVVHHLLGVEGIEENLHKDAKVAPLNLKRYAIVKFWKLLLSGRETYHRFVHPEGIIEHIEASIRQSKALQKDLEHWRNEQEWRKGLPITGSPEEMRCTIKALLVDMGVLTPETQSLAGKIADATKNFPLAHTVACHLLFIPPIAS